MGATAGVALKMVQVPLHNSSGTVSTAEHALDMSKVTIVGVESILQTRELRPCCKTPAKWSPYYITSNDNMPAATNGDPKSALYAVSVDKRYVTLLRRTDDTEYNGAVVKVVLWYEPKEA